MGESQLLAGSFGLWLPTAEKYRGLPRSGRHREGLQGAISGMV